MRSRLGFFSLAVLLTLVFTLPARGDDQKVAPKAPPKSKFKTAIDGAKLKSGFIDLYVNEKKGKVLASLGAKNFDKNFLLMSSISRGIGAKWIYSGLTLDDYLCAFRKAPGNRVYLVRRVTRYRGNPGTPTDRAVKMSYSDSIIASLPIIAEEGGKALVDLGTVFLTDFAAVGSYISQGLGGAFRLDRAKSNWSEVKAFPHNVELRVNLTFTGKPGSGEDIVPDARGVSTVFHYSIRDLSDLGGYTPRHADDRVGYFLTAFKDFSGENRTPFVRYVNRFRLEKANPKAALSPPKKPIVFWIENTVPYEFRPHVRAGILAWNKAFEAAGFLDAIEVRQMPDDAEWDPEDANYNTFRWVTSHELGYGAIGPSRVNPLTGEILDADILFESEMVRNYTNIFKRYSPTEDGAIPPGLKKLFTGRRGVCMAGLHRHSEAMFGALAYKVLYPEAKDVPASYIGALVRSVVTHEVGHTIGLRHNMKGSTLHKNADLQNEEVTKAIGLTGSVMDYLPVNFSSDPKKQGEYFESSVGPYDVWAVRYGYTPLKGGSNGERAGLLEIAAEGNQKGHAYGTDEDSQHGAPIGYGMDPLCSTDDIGADPLLFVQDRLKLVDLIMKGDWSRFATKEDGWVPVTSAVSRTINAKGYSLSLAAKWVGGVYANRNHKGDPDEQPPILPVDAKRQREALKTILDNAMAPDSWQIDPKVLLQMAPGRWSHWGSRDGNSSRVDFSMVSHILMNQRRSISALMNPQLQSRVLDNELRAPENPFTLAELYTGLTEALFAELAGPEISIPMLRREMQLRYVQTLRGILLGRSHPEEARTQAYGALRTLSGRLGNGGDVATESHLRRLAQLIKSTLEAYTQAR